MTRFQPILLGSDINVYGMARAFHEEYGIVSEAYAYFQLSPTKFSRIVNVHIVDDFNNFVTFRNFMLKLGKRMKAEDPERVLLLIPCGDVYANLLSQCGDDLREYFVYNTLDVNLSRRLAYKSTFYQICEQYDLPHPKTRTVTADEVKAGAYRDLPFSYPVAMKPANSVEWLNIDFEGRRKAYIFNDPAELETIIKRAYDAGYTSDIKYEGVANFDMKYDERDGEYKLFEINLRQGRSSYFVTLNGFNLAKYFVDDLVEDTPFDGNTLFGRGSKLWLEIPKSIFLDYVAEGTDKETGKRMLKSGDWGTTLEYSKDMNPLRWLMIRHMFSIYKKSYAKYFTKKGELK